MRGIHYDSAVLVSIEPVAVGTTGTGKTGRIVDRKGWKRVELLTSFGAITATNCTFTVTMLHGDATGSMASVADTDLEGTEALAGLAAAARVDFSTEKVSKRLGYKGNKRYVQAKIVSTATAGTPVAANFLLTEPEVAPNTAQVN